MFGSSARSLSRNQRTTRLMWLGPPEARMGRNPQTGEPVKIKASKKVTFRASKELKEAV